MKLEYKIEPIIFHLKHIKKMCLENPDCTGCPFNKADKYSERLCLCMFAGDDIDIGVIPQDWELEEVEKEETRCITCKYFGEFSLDCARCHEYSEYEPK